MRATKRLMAWLCAMTLVVVGASGSYAYQTEGLLLYVDANDPASYSASAPTTWNDISSNARSATIAGAVTYGNGALNFPGASTAYAAFPAGFDNFGTGITIETEVSFGATLGPWERIFDFGNGPANNNLWLGHYSWSTDPNSQGDELAVEVWHGGTNRGRCKTAAAVNALVPNTFAKFIVTLDGTTCHIYKDGVEVDTEIDGGNGVWTNNGATLSSSYPYLPLQVVRNYNYIGKSNWVADGPFEGAIKYVRIYDRAISPAAAVANSTDYTITYSTAGSTSGTAPAPRVGNGQVTLAANPGNLARPGYTFLGWSSNPSATSGLPSNYNLTANVTMYPVWYDPTPFETRTLELKSASGDYTHSFDVRVGSSLNYTLSAPRYTVAGAEFNGWNLAADGTGKSYALGAVIDIPKSTVLYAQWRTSHVASASPVATRLIRSFAGDSSRLSASLKSQISAYAASLAQGASLVCVGQTSNTKLTPADTALARARANAVCGYISSLRNDLQTSIELNPSSGVGPIARSVIFRAAK